MHQPMGTQPQAQVQQNLFANMNMAAEKPKQEQVEEIGFSDFQSSEA